MLASQPFFLGTLPSFMRPQPILRSFPDHLLQLFHEHSCHIIFRTIYLRYLHPSERTLIITSAGTNDIGKKIDRLYLPPYLLRSGKNSGFTVQERNKEMHAIPLGKVIGYKADQGRTLFPFQFNHTPQCIFHRNTFPTKLVSLLLKESIHGLIIQRMVN